MQVYAKQKEAKHMLDKSLSGGGGMNKNANTSCKNNRHILSPLHQGVVFFITLHFNVAV